MATTIPDIGAPGFCPCCGSANIVRMKGVADESLARPGVATLALAVLAAALGCERDTRPPGRGAAAAKLTVAVSIAPQAWLVQQIGGEHVEVITITKPGDSPATYQPNDAEISRLMHAAAYFRIGVPFENGRWFQAVREAKTIHIVDTRKGITLRSMAADGDKAHDHGGDDPHIWLSPPLLKVQAETVAAALCQLNPDHEAAYRANLATVSATLDATDETIRSILLPIKGRAFFVFHPSWGYFADAYGLQQIAIETDGKDPSDHELTSLQAAARGAGARVIFVQPQISGRSAQAVAKSIGGRVQELDPLAPNVPMNLVHAAQVIAAAYE